MSVRNLVSMYEDKSKETGHSIYDRTVSQGVALAREKLAGSIDGVGNIFSEKF